MGNGEQYIWKPPEDEDIITLHPPPHRGDNGQGHPSPPTAKEVVQFLSLWVCGIILKQGGRDQSMVGWKDRMQDGRKVGTVLALCDHFVYCLGAPF